MNASLLQVEALNADILRLQSTGSDISTLEDARQTVVDGIAGIVPLRQTVRENGTISLMTTSGTNLIDGRAVQFDFDATPTITADMTLASGALGAVLLDGTAIGPATGIGRLDGGSLGAAFAMRDATLVDVQDGLDEIAADLIARFQDPNNDPSLNPGDLGILTDEGGTLDLSDIPGIAGRIALNPAVDPSLGGNVVLFRDGLNATVPGPVGNSTQLDRWILALAETRSDLPGSAERSASGRAVEFVAQVGATRLTAEEQLSFTAARWDTLHAAELANGVDTDLELQQLLRIEQAYAANARVIQTADFLMQRLMEL